MLPAEHTSVSQIRKEKGSSGKTRSNWRIDLALIFQAKKGCPKYDDSLFK